MKDEKSTIQIFTTNHAVLDALETVAKPDDLSNFSMTKHSKNNTASSIFSYAEYKKLDAYYGTKKQRLGNESMRPFDACSLCLQRAREPLACSKGHLFCKECVYNDLLAQKKDMKRVKDKMEAMRREEEEAKKEAREKARERVLRDFELGQLGIGMKRKEMEGQSAAEQGASLCFLSWLLLTLSFQLDGMSSESLNSIKKRQML